VEHSAPPEAEAPEPTKIVGRDGKSYPAVTPIRLAGAHDERFEALSGVIPATVEQVPNGA
jgi:hypothetical protein